MILVRYRILSEEIFFYALLSHSIPAVFWVCVAMAERHSLMGSWR